MWKAFVFYWICLVAVRIMLLAPVCACKKETGPTGPPVRVCVCAFFFDPYDQQSSSIAYWVFSPPFFACGTAASPAASCLCRLQHEGGGGEEKRMEVRGDGYREVGGRERSVDRLWESQGFHVCRDWTTALFVRLALGIHHIFIFSSRCAAVLQSRKAGLYF